VNLRKTWSILKLTVDLIFMTELWATSTMLFELYGDLEVVENQCGVSIMVVIEKEDERKYR
jgi:hypothetical protein